MGNGARHSVSLKAPKMNNINQNQHAFRQLQFGVPKNAFDCTFSSSKLNLFRHASRCLAPWCVPVCAPIFDNRLLSAPRRPHVYKFNALATKSQCLFFNPHPPQSRYTCPARESFSPWLALPRNPTSNQRSLSQSPPVSPAPSWAEQLPLCSLFPS
ncbi:hypothetical protein B0H12DRAFT_697048 [Mycena haematopus]|nr:hypothetical protein B0H12DRAFT_697048 [Mycena haematopus]